MATSSWPTPKSSTRPTRDCGIWSEGCGQLSGCSTVAHERGATCGKLLLPTRLDSMGTVPWYIDYDGSAPSACEAGEIEPLTDLLQAGLAAAGVQLLAVRSRAVFAHQFNDLIERYGSKGAALSHQTLALAAAMIEPLPARADLADLRQTRRPKLLRAHWQSIFPSGSSRSAAKDVSGASTTSGRRNAASRSHFASRRNRICRSLWPRWRQNIFASWRCRRSTSSAPPPARSASDGRISARCQAILRRHCRNTTAVEH